MKINSWLFNWRYTQRLKKLNSFENKIKVEADLIRSICILEILGAIEPLLLSINKSIQKLRVKSIQHVRTLTNTDMFGNRSLLPNPLFSQNQIGEIVHKYLLNLIVIIAFVVMESYLYSITASLFLPGAPELVKVAVSIFLALLIMVSLQYAFEKHFLYREALAKHGCDEISATELKQYRDKRRWGNLLMVLSFLAIIFSGCARIAFLEQVEGKGISFEKLESIQRASDFGSIFTMIVTIIGAVIMSLMKQEQVKLGVQFRLFRYWFKTHRRRNLYTQELIHDSNKVLLLTEQKIEKYWQFVIHLKKVFQIEYDEKFEQLNQKYLQLKAQPGFSVTDDVYAKFFVLAAAYEELFKYGIRNSREIKEKIAFIVEKLRIPEVLHSEQLPHAELSKPEAIQDHHVPQTNGKAAKLDISSIKNL